MMRIGLAVLMTGLVAGQAYAGDLRDTVARKFGEAAAIALRCDRLRVNPARMAAYTQMLDMPLDDTMKAIITIHHNSALTTLHERDDASVCAVGRYLYGPEGINAPGILVEE